MGRKYLNLGRNHDPSFSEFVGLVRTKRPKWVYRPLDTHFPPPPERVEGDALRITFVNHMTVLIQGHGKNILTDPIWSSGAPSSQWAGPKRFAPPGVAFDALPPIDAILLSHDHYDHLCLPTLKRIARRGNPIVFTGKGVARTVKNLDSPTWWNWTGGRRMNGQRDGRYTDVLPNILVDEPHLIGTRPCG